MRALVLAAALAVGAGTAEAASYTAEYVFGDSLTDSGNLVLLTQANPALFPGFQHPSPPYAGGRFSNGPVWVELLGQALGLPVTPSLAGGTNFSFAGALTGSGAIPSVVTQAGQYLASRGGVADPNALYVVTGGGNDIRAATSPNLAIAQTAADNLALVLSQLYSAGARNFLVATPPNVSLLPEVQGPGATLAGARALRAGLSELLRTDLLADVSVFAASRPAAKVAELDVTRLLQDAVARPGAYGYTNVTDACFNTSMATLCSNPSSYLFFDGVHSTEPGQVLLAQAALTAVPEPGSLALLAMGLLGVLAAMRRRLRG